VAVAALGIVVNTGTALLFLRGRHDDINVGAAFWHMAADAAVSAGVVLAGVLAWLYGWRWVDPVASLGIAVVIVIGSWGLLRQSLHLLFDGVPEQLNLDDVRAALQALPGVTQVHDLHVWATGTRDLALTAHLVMPAGHPGDALLRQATQQMHDRFHIGHVTLQVVRAPFTEACSPR
jgi:cobalt-zinc-cadmium efflux system protein